MLAHANPLLDLIASSFVERKDSGIKFDNLEIDFGAAEIDETPLTFCDQRLANPQFSMRGSWGLSGYPDVRVA
jgi:hypothetical protein